MRKVPSISGYAANTYINQRTHPTCIYNVQEYFTTGHELTIHEKLFIELLN